MDPYSVNGELVFNSYKADNEGEIETKFFVNNTDIGSIYKVRTESPAANSITDSGFTCDLKTYNTGHSWTTSGFYLIGGLLSMSGSGKYGIAVGTMAGSTAGGIYFSNDYGQNWQLSEGDTSFVANDIWGMSMSADGKIAICTGESFC